MGIILGRGEPAISLGRALGLPKRTRRFVLTVDSADAIRVNAEYFADDDQIAEVVRILTDGGWVDDPDRGTEATQ